MGYDVPSMAVFTVLSLSDNPATLDARVKEQFPNDHLSLAPGRWVVAADGIVAKDVADKLGNGTTLGLFTVFAISGYYGWATNTLWEWLALKSNPAKHG
jgi:hypothetical protein